MPQYEYECIEDGELLTLLRPMREADLPVEDPRGSGRTFKRVHSIFGVARSGTGSADVPSGGHCPCGLAPGSCQDL